MRVTSTTCVTDGDPRRLGRAHCASSGSAGREGVDAAGTTGHRPAGDEHRERRRSSGRDAHSGAPGGGAPPRLSADTPSQRSGRLAGSRAHAQPPAIPRKNWSWRLCGCRHSRDRRLRAGDNQCPTFPDVSGPAAALHALILNPAHCRGRHRNHSGADHVRPGGVIDNSFVIDLEHLDAGQLPVELAVSAITMAELAAGTHTTGDANERARRQDRLPRAEAAFDPLPFDGEDARLRTDLRSRSRRWAQGTWHPCFGSFHCSHSQFGRAPDLHA